MPEPTRRRWGKTALGRRTGPGQVSEVLLEVSLPFLQEGRGGRCAVLSRFSLCDPLDGSPPGSSVHGILQARTLEWFAVSFSHGPVAKPVSSSLRAPCLPSVGSVMLSSCPSMCPQGPLVAPCP